MSQGSVTDLVTNERVARALFALLELSKALGSEVDLDALLRVIVEKASSVVDAERTSIYVYDAARERLWSRVAQGLGTQTIEVSLGSGIAGSVARTRTLENIRDAYADERFNQSFDQRTGFRTRSILCAPVLDSDGTLLGVIQSVNKTTAPHFDESDEALMLALASHVAVAFARAHLTEVHLQNERYEQALQVAHDIQMRMLPRPSAAGANGEFDLTAHLRPAKEVGGDLYDYFVLGNRLFFCIGDVSGKGAGAALVMAVTKTLFRANAVVQDDPASVLSAMSARIYEETDPSMFVTAFCGWLELDSGKIRFANAGHERPIRLGARGREATHIDSRPGIALGVFPSFVYQNGETTLAAGESLFLITDGVTDATSASTEMFGTERVMETLQGHGATDAKAAIETLLHAVDSFVGDEPQADDITMMCIRYLPGSTSEALT